MAKSKEPIRRAREIFDEFLSKADPEAVVENPPPDRTAQQKEAGRKGGLKGGKARAKKLSTKKRKEIAKKAVLTRWRDARKAS